MNQQIRRTITIFGVINTLSFAVYTLLSYGLSPLVPFGQVSESKSKFIIDNVDSLKFLTGVVKGYLLGRNPFTDPWKWIFAYCLPLLITATVFIILLWRLSQKKDQLGEDVPGLLFRWGVVFCLIVMLAMPILVQDFWYPLGWGRMINSGVNPYYVALNEAPHFFIDLPVASTSEKMMYGPLWALFNSFVMGAARGNLWLGAIFFKLLFASTWIGALFVTRGLLSAQPIWNQAVGIMILSWIPVGVIQIVGDGHNDIVMLFFILFWLYGLGKRWRLASKLSLVFSVLIKYITAPLIILDFLHMYYQDKTRIWKYLVYLGVAGLIGLAMLALFYRSLEMFSYLSIAKNWHFYAPADAIRTIFDLTGHNIPGATLLARLFFGLILIIYMVIYIKYRDTSSLWAAALAVIAFLLFGINRHIWPWYIVWVLGLAALVPGSRLARWVIGLSLLMPFPIIIWITFPNLDDYYIFRLPALFLYLFSLVWLVVAPSRWFPEFSYEMGWRSKKITERTKIED